MGGPDAALPQEPSVLVVVVAAVGEEHVRPSARPADDSGHCRDLVQQGQQLGDVVAVAAGQRRRERDPLAVGDDVVLAARACAVDRAGAALGPAVQPGRGRSRSPPATSPAGSSSAACSAATGAVGPRHRPRSGPPGASSTSCPSRSPAPAGGTPTGCRCAGGTRSRTRPDGPGPLADPRPASVAAQAATARWATTVHPARHDPRPRLTLPHVHVNE